MYEMYPPPSHWRGGGGGGGGRPATPTLPFLRSCMGKVTLIQHQIYFAFVSEKMTIGGRMHWLGRED